MKKTSTILMIVGLVVFLAGIGAIGYASHAKGRISKAKKDIDMLTSPFEGSSGGDAARGVLRGKASQYDNDVRLLTIGGVILICIGGALAITGLRKR